MSRPSHPASSGFQGFDSSGRILAVLGPTNTGKTHFAIDRLLGHQSGMIGLPLRLLAREVYDRFCAVKGEGAVALVTGEEKIVPRHPSYWVTTVESMPLDVSVECLAVDEIQLAADPERGHIFTDRLLRARGRSETIFLGAETMRPVIAKLIPSVQFITRPRFSDLAYTGARKISRLPRRSAVVAFSANGVYALAELIRRQRGGAAVVMGALSPRTRNAQVALYQSGDVDFLVATDAIGMGLNMDIDHVAFAETEKFDGTVRRALRAQELAQIAGRAGRHMNDGTFGTTGDANALDQETVEAIESHRFDPVRVVQWRNPELDFSSLQNLMASLDATPPIRGLSRARAADDLLALRMLAQSEDIQAKAIAPAAIKQLWEVCQVPDFRKLSLEEHVNILKPIYEHLLSHEGVLPEDWIKGHVERLDSTEGEIDTIATRIAHVRTWTYCVNRNHWLADAEHWQERTRAIEDRLSDALHEKLTQRFVDRRTSVLMKRLREEESFAATVDEEGEVLVDGEYVGRLQGFSFVADPRALGIHGKALRSAAFRGLASEIADRAHRLSIAPEATITLSEHGRLWWNGGIVGQLVKGADPLTPRVELLADELLSQSGRDRAAYRLQGWINGHIDKTLAPLLALNAALEIPETKIAASDVDKAPDEELANLGDAPSLMAALAQSAEAHAAQMDEESDAEEGLAETEHEAVPTDDTGSGGEEPPAQDARPEDSDVLAEAVTESGTDDVLPVEASGAMTPEGEDNAPASAKSRAKNSKHTEKKNEGPQALTGIARGIVFQLVENLGAISRARIGQQLKAMPQDSRGPMRKLGIRFGQHSIFLPALVKPGASRLKALLWAVHAGLKDVPPPPPAGLTSVPVDGSAPNAFLEAAGFRVCGGRAVRLDMLERLADLIRAKGQSGQLPESFEASADMMSIIGTGAEDLAIVLRGLGFRDSPHTKEDGTSSVMWRARPRPRGGEEGGPNARAKRGQRPKGRGAPGAKGRPSVAAAAPDGAQAAPESTQSADANVAERPARPEGDSGKPRRHGRDRDRNKGGERGDHRPRAEEKGGEGQRTEARREDGRRDEGRRDDHRRRERAAEPKSETRPRERERQDRNWSKPNPQGQGQQNKSAKKADPDSPFAILSQIKFNK